MAELPHVVIRYSHDNVRYKLKVLEHANRVRREGIRRLNQIK